MRSSTLWVHLHVAYDCVGHYVSWSGVGLNIAEDKKALLDILTKRDGQHLISRLDQIGVTSPHMLCVLACMLVHRREPYLRMVTLALGIGETSCEALLQLLQEMYVESVSRVRHRSSMNCSPPQHSLISDKLGAARVALNSDLFKYVETTVWRDEARSPTPRYDQEAEQEIFNDWWQLIATGMLQV